MIGWFPTPYPDEILYSICARYKEQVAYPSHYSANEDLFGSRYIYAGIVLPTHLELLTSALPSSHHLTADRLIDNHTLLPFYSYFLAADRVSRIREEMRFGDGSRIRSLVGIHRFTVRLPDWLRFCPECIEEDRARFGCTYWHRVHQLSGVEVCPDHAVLLEDSQARARDRRAWHGYMLADHSVRDCHARPIVPSNATHAFLLSIARDAKWLLHNGNAQCDLKALLDRYLALLSDREMAVMTGTIWGRKLRPAIKAHFPTNFLSLFQSDFDEKNPVGWPIQLLKNLPEGNAHHPLHHCLMMQFLGHNVESFIKLPTTRQPFGEGPWPCLNRTCARYKIPRITKAKIVYRNAPPKGTCPVATFKCGDCGFTYFRVGPDPRGEDMFRISRVLEFGPVWEEALRLFWNDNTLLLSSGVIRLGITIYKFKREAKRLGLPFPRHGPGNRVTKEDREQKRQLPKMRPSKEKIDQYRQEWLLILKNNPGPSPHLLQQKCRRHISNWLKRHDSQWFAAHPAPRRKRHRDRRQVDKRARDAAMAKLIKPTAKLLKETPGKPVKITTALIAKEIENGSRLLNLLHQLPQTRKAIEKVVETRLQFAERRLWWADRSLREENLTLSRTALIRRAYVCPEDWEALQLKAASDAALRNLLLEYGVGN